MRTSRRINLELPNKNHLTQMFFLDPLSNVFVPNGNQLGANTLGSFGEFLLDIVSNILSRPLSTIGLVETIFKLMFEGFLWMKRP